MNNTTKNYMTFLIDTEIEALVKQSKLFRQDTFSSDQLSACAYDLRAGDHLVSRNRGISIRLDRDGYPVQPGEVVTIRTKEWLDLSDPYLVGIIGNSHTQLSQGIFHPLTVIDPGFKGYLAITLINSGNSVYTISEGDRIAKLLLAPVSSKPSRLYGSKYPPRVRPGALEHALYFERDKFDALEWNELTIFFGGPLSMIVSRIEKLEKEAELYHTKAQLERYRKFWQVLWTVLAGAAGAILAQYWPTIQNFFQQFIK